MSPRTNKQNEEIRRNKELLIIESALLLFSRDGYNSASMQSIAKEAGVSKGNLYNYFVGKEELLEAVLKHGLDQFSNVFTGQSSQIYTEADFDLAIKANFNLLRSNETFWKLYYNLIAQPKVQDLFTKIFLPFLDQYMKIFESYFKNKGDQNAGVTALLLGSAIDGISLGYFMMGEAYPLEEIVDQLIIKFK